MTAGEILKMQFEGISNPIDTIEILNRNAMTKKIGLLPPITRIDEEDEDEDEDEDEYEYGTNYNYVDVKLVSSYFIVTTINN